MNEVVRQTLENKLTQLRRDLVFNEENFLGNVDAVRKCVEALARRRAEISQLESALLEGAAS